MAGGRVEIKRARRAQAQITTEGETAVARPSVRFSKLSTISHPPSSHTAQVIFGGHTADYKVLGDVWAFDLEALVWRQPAVTGTPLSPRARTGATVWEDTLVITGGIGKNGSLLADAAALRVDAADCSKLTWIPLPPVPQEGGVMDHSATLYDVNFHDTINDTVGAQLAVLLHGGVGMEGLAINLAAELLIDSSTWRVLPLAPQLPHPSRRCAHTGLWIDNIKVALFTLGGTFTGDLVAYNVEQWAYNPKSGAWLPVRLTNYPDRRMHPMMSAVGESSEVILFGGRFSSQSVNNHTWVFDANARRWGRTYPKVAPTARDGGTLTGFNFNIILYGGRDDELRPLGDLWGRRACSNCGNENWVSMKDVNEKSAAVPAPRALHTASGWSPGDSSSHMLVFGGVGADAQGHASRLLGDLWHLKWDVGSTLVTDARWFRLTTTGDVPAPRAGHAAAVVFHSSAYYLYVFGGVVGDRPDSRTSSPPIYWPQGRFGTQLSNDVYILDIAKLKWGVLRQPTTVHDASIWPAPTVFSLMTVVDSGRSHNQLVLVSGLLTLPGDRQQVVHSRVYLAEAEVQPGQPPSISFLEVTLEDEPLLQWGGAIVNHPLHQRAVLHVSGMGPYSADGDMATSTLSQLQLACPPGYYEFQEGSSKDPDTQAGCRKCPLGFYSEEPAAASCSPCEGGTYTSSVGAFSRLACNVCRPGWCHRGSCHVRLNFNAGDEEGEALCQCPAGWDGDQCQINVFGIAFGSSFAIMAVVALIYLLVRNTHSRIRLLKYDKVLREQLLAENEQELRRLESVWEIDAEEVHLVRRIDGDSPGAQGEVRCHRVGLAVD
jgi:hypothetical protein